MKFNENVLRRIKISFGFLVLLAFVAVLGVSAGWVKSDAAEYQDIGIHNPDEEGISKVGVKITVDGAVVGYGYDLWIKRTDGKWELNLSGTDSKIVTIHGNTLNGDRFKVDFEQLKKFIPDECTVTLDVYKKGERVRNESEYTYDKGAKFIEKSLLEMKYNNQKKDIKLCSYTPREESYVYNITTALKIEKDGDINASTEYSELLNDGYAFYNSASGKYIINKLPDIRYYDDENCMYQFMGWYIEENDSEKRIYEGDSISNGDTIYAKWEKIYKKYTVKFIDKVVKDGSEEILGTKSIQIEYGTTVKASDYLGKDTSANAYYQGRYYTGNEDAIVVSSIESLNTISRYFDNVMYNVNVVDKIICGPSEGETLGESTIQKGYSEKVQGEDIGCDETSGRYYMGYMYNGCSDLTVTSEDNTVYRYFKPVSYMIDFDGNGATSGEMDDDTEYFYGEQYELPVNKFIKESKVSLNKNADYAELELSSINVENEFAGWSKEIDGDIIYKNSDSFINLRNECGAEKLYANWKTNDLSVNVVPKRKGYLFAGWAEEPDADKGYTNFKIMGDKELYAVWVPDRQEYTIQIFKEEADGSYELTERIVNKKGIGDIVKFSDLSMPKDKYTGYILNEKKSDSEVKVESDGTAVIKVYYDRCRYVINYIGYIDEKESVVATDGAICGVPYELPKVIGKINNPYRYKDDKGKVYNSGDKITINDNIKIYPQFKISYNEKEYTDTYVNYGASIKLNDNKKTGYNFEGWYDDKELKNLLGKPQDNIKNISSNITIFPKWSEPLMYNITYDLKNSGVIILNGDVKSYTYMERVVLPTENQMIIPEGWRFEGWTYEGTEDIISEIQAGEFGDKKLCIVVNKSEQNNNENSGNVGNPENNDKDNTSDENNNNISGDKNNNNISDDKNNNNISGGDEKNDDKGAGKKPEVVKGNNTSKKTGVVKKGNKYTIKDIRYTVTKSVGNSREVKVTGIKKSMKTLVIPDTVTINKKKYKVTSISARAFDKCKSIKKVSIGCNIRTIGKEAFYKSSNVKSVTIKSKIIKSIGKNAFSGLKSKCIIKINAKSKSLKKVYKSVLSNKKIIVKKYK